MLYGREIAEHEKHLRTGVLFYLIQKHKKRNITKIFNFTNRITLQKTDDKTFGKHNHKPSILCSILMIFYPVFSLQFYITYITYIICGISDMIDGAVARATNNSTKFGSQLDSIADITFIVAASIKLLPIIHISNWLWTWITIIAIIKTSNITLGFFRTKKLVFQHTTMNKITGLSLFILPLTLSFIEIKYSAIITCSIATFAAIQEWCKR